MRDSTILYIPTVQKPPFELKDIIYNCPVCDYEIEIDLIVDEKSSVVCEVCDHIIKLEIKKI